MKAKLILLSLLVMLPVCNLFAYLGPDCGGCGEESSLIPNVYWVMNSIRINKNYIRNTISQTRYRYDDVQNISELIRYAKTKKPEAMKYVEEARLWAAYLGKTDMYHLLYCATISDADDYLDCKYKTRKLKSYLEDYKDSNNKELGWAAPRG